MRPLLCAALLALLFVWRLEASQDNSKFLPTSPVGVYVWFSDPGGPKSDEDCRAFTARVSPSLEKLDRWLQGRLPANSPDLMTSYLVITETRMEPTFSAEGDYDFGDVVFGPTHAGETGFTLTPDDHPQSTIRGTIIAKPESEIVTVKLYDIPLNDGNADRTIHYCRFEEPLTTT